MPSDTKSMGLHGKFAIVAAELSDCVGEVGGDRGLLFVREDEETSSEEGTSW